MSEPAKKIADVSVNEVHIAPGRRDDPKRVEELATSMRVSGLLQPIGVTPQKKLIFGLHRLMAARQLGWATIPTVTLDLDELHTELAEIDENLERRQLPALELGEVLLRRKEIYEQLHPTTRHGGDRKSDQSKSSEDDLHLISFADGAARRLGVQPATVRQYIRVARRVPPELRRQLRPLAIGERITELEKLAKLAQDDQRCIVEELVNGTQSVDAAIQAVNKGRAEADRIMLRKRSTRCRPDPAESMEAAFDESDTVAPESAEEVCREVAEIDTDSPTSSGIGRHDHAEDEPLSPEDPDGSSESGTIGGEQRPGDVEPTDGFRVFLRGTCEQIARYEEQLDELVPGILNCPERDAIIDDLDELQLFFTGVRDAVSALDLPEDHTAVAVEALT